MKNKYLSTPYGSFSGSDVAEFPIPSPHQLIYEQVFYRSRNTTKPIFSNGGKSVISALVKYFNNSTIHTDLGSIEEFEVIIIEEAFSINFFKKLIPRLSPTGILVIKAKDTIPSSRISRINSLFPEGDKEYLSTISNASTEHNTIIICDRVINHSIHRAKCFNYNGRFFNWLFEPIIKMHIEEADLLFKYCENSKGDVIEIGRYKGGSTSIILEALKYNPHAKLISIDISSQYLHPRCKEIFNEYEAKLELITANSLEVNLNFHFYILFIDGDHSTEAVINDFEKYFTNLIVGGYVLFHDYADTHHSVVKAVDFILEEYADQLEVEERKRSLLIVKKLK